MDEFTSGFGSWAASAGWVKSNTLLGSDGLASLLLWTLLWDTLVPVTAAEWVLEAENLLESGSADEVVGASEVFTGLLGDAVSDLALAWLAHVVVLLPGLSVFVDDAVVLADWGTAALAVGLALALIEVVGGGADMSGSVTGGVAVLAWFLALLWWALALLGWATTGWLVVAINNLTVVSALNSWGWASLADASVTHATVFRTGNVSTGIVFLVFATTWVWVEFWELDGALSPGRHTDALWWIDWKTFGLLAALGNGESVNSLVFGTDWVGVTSIPEVLAGGSTVLVALAWLADVLVLVPSTTVLLSFITISTLAGWAIAVLSLAAALVGLFLDFTALVAHWLGNNWARWVTDTLSLGAALVVVEVSHLDEVKLVTSLTGWSEWHLVSKSFSAGVWLALGWSAFVDWAALGLVLVANKLEGLVGLAVSNGKWGLVSTGKSLVLITDVVITVALVDVAFTAMSPGGVLVLGFLLASGWVGPDTLFGHALDESFATVVLLSDSDILWVWTGRWGDTVGWIALAFVSAASGLWTLHEGCLWKKSEWHTVDTAHAVVVVDDLLSESVERVALASGSRSLENRRLVALLLDTAPSITDLGTAIVTSVTAPDSSLAARTLHADVSVEYAVLLVWVLKDLEEDRSGWLVRKWITGWLVVLADLLSGGNAIDGDELALASVTLSAVVNLRVLEVVLVESVFLAVDDAFLVDAWLLSSVLALVLAAAFTINGDLLGDTGHARIGVGTVWLISEWSTEILVADALV